jgi:serine/threonine-protein kinase
VLASGRYRVEKTLGEGGMGVVFQAIDTRLGRKVAVKLLRPELLAHPTARTRMTTEANALARIEHPNVVRMLDVFDEGPALALVLELVTGGDLAQKIPPAGLPQAQVLPWMAGILAGVQAIHQAELVHRDIKPSNVLLTATGVPKITDLGVARDNSRERVTVLNARLGTYEYMSPECVQGAGVDARSDVYSCGVLMYEMLCGSPPFRGQDFEIAAAQVGQSADLSKLSVNASPSVIGVVARALAKEPARRWSSAQGMAEALLEAVQAQAGPLFASPPAFRAVAEPRPARMESPRQSATTSFPAWPWTAALLAVGAGLWLFLNWGAGATAAPSDSAASVSSKADAPSSGAPGQRGTSEQTSPDAPEAGPLPTPPRPAAPPQTAPEPASAPVISDGPAASASEPKSRRRPKPPLPSAKEPKNDADEKWKRL